MSSEHQSNPHGGQLDQFKTQFSPTQPWIDLSTGINPWSYPISISNEIYTSLPTQFQIDACKTAMAAAWQCPATSILPVPGLEIIFRLLPAILASEAINIANQSYGDYERSWQLNKGQVYKRDSEQTLKAQQHVFDSDLLICNPNNPNGERYSALELETIYQQCLRAGKWLILDEAYGELWPENSLSKLAGKPQLIILKSFGKFYGLPGLRLGAVLAPSEVLVKLANKLGHWVVSSAALAVGATAYSNISWQDTMRKQLFEASDMFKNELISANIEIAGHCPLFSLVKVADAKHGWETLMQAGIYTRQFSWSPQLLRIGLPKDLSEARRVTKALNSVVKAV